MAHYIGNLESLEAELQAYPVNTDNHPVIEFIAPITQRMIKAQRANWLTESALIDLMKKMQQRIPPERDHFLSLITKDDRDAAKAGYHLHHGRVLKEAGQPKEAEAEYAIFQSLLNPST
jgi:spermidine synthase